MRSERVTTATSPASDQHSEALRKAHPSAAPIEALKRAGSRALLRDLAYSWIHDIDELKSIDEISGQTERTYRNTCLRYILGYSPLGGATDRTHEGKFFNGAIPHLTIAQANDEIVAERLYREVMKLGYSRGTARAARTVLGRMVTYAKKHRIIERNNIKFLQIKHSRAAEEELRAVVPEPEHVAALLRAIEPRDDLMIRFALLSGLRTSEQRALRWSDLNETEGFVTVTRSMSANDGMTRVKSMSSRRSVPIAASLLKQLRAVREERMAFSSALIFPSERGTPLNHANVHVRLWKPAWERATAEWSRREPLVPFTWHQMRHFAVACWIRHGANHMQVMTWAGHKNIQTTLNLYGHLFRQSDPTGVMDAAAGEITG